MLVCASFLLHLGGGLYLLSEEFRFDPANRGCVRGVSTMRGGSFNDIMRTTSYKVESDQDFLCLNLYDTRLEIPNFSRWCSRSQA
jgi:hypothetical protein